MNEEQWTSLFYSTLFNGPIVVVGFMYLRLCVKSYRKHHDARAVRGVTIAFGFVAALIGGWARGISNIANNAPPAVEPFRALIFACFVISLGALVAVVRSWYRNER